MDILIGTLGLLVNWLLGGGLSRFLDAIPPVTLFGHCFYFKEWHPDPAWKSFCVGALACVIGGAVTFAINYLMPVLFGLKALDAPTQVLIAFMVSLATFVSAYVNNANAKQKTLWDILQQQQALDRARSGLDLKYPLPPTGGVESDPAQP